MGTNTTPVSQNEVAPTSIQDFDLKASPPSWYEVAKLLNEQAGALHRNRASLILETRNGRTTSRYVTNRGVFLLAGFSVENMLKAFTIYEHPEYVAHGRLSKELRTHQLSRLWKASKLVPYKARFTPVVLALEDGLESWARYPCGLTHERNSFELSMTEQLWDGYSRMFAACGQRLERLLTKGWKNANGERAYMQYG